MSLECQDSQNSAHSNGKFQKFELNLSERAESAFPFMKLFDGLTQLRLAEIGPEFIGHDDFGVTKLPEQEIGEAHLPGSADQQIGIGIRTSIKMLLEELGIHLRGI